MIQLISFHKNGFIFAKITILSMSFRIRSAVKNVNKPTFRFQCKIFKWENRKNLLYILYIKLMNEFIQDSFAFVQIVYSICVSSYICILNRSLLFFSWLRVRNIDLKIKSKNRWKSCQSLTIYRRTEKRGESEEGEIEIIRQNEGKL